MNILDSKIKAAERGVNEVAHLLYLEAQIRRNAELIRATDDRIKRNKSRKF